MVSLAKQRITRPRWPAAAASGRDRLLTLAHLLSVDQTPAQITALRRSMQADEPCWPELVALANRELLAPALWVALCDKGLTGELPAANADYLRRARAVNAVRNTRMASELDGVIRVLNDAGIEPVLLKGAVDLVAPRYSDPAARVLRDLDLLVPRSQCPDALAALAGAGYRPKKDWLESYFYELSRPAAMAPIDLQWYVSAQRDVLPPEDAYGTAMTMAQGAARFRILSPEHQVVHNVLHSELQDRGSQSRFVWLRQLLDLVAICRHTGQGLDWGQVRDCFARRGVEHVLVARLFMAHRLLGLAMPAGMDPTPAARAHLRRALARLDRPRTLAARSVWATISSQFDPRLIDLIYGSGKSRLRLGRDRFRHGLRLLGQHGLNFGSAIRNQGTKYQ